MSLYWRVPVFVLAALAISCSGPQSTEIVPKTGGGGDNPGPDFPNKPSKSKHDSLGQLSLAAADFVEVEAIVESLLRQDLNENSHPQACPRRRLEGQNDDKTRWYFSLNWSKCGRSFVKSGLDCAAVTTGSPGDLTFDAITKVEINPVVEPVPVRDCAKSRFYVSESTTVFSDSGLTMEKVAKSEKSARFQFRRDQLLVYQREKSNLDLNQTIKYQGDILIPHSEQEKIQFLIDNNSKLETELTETRAKSTFYDNVVATAPDNWTHTQQCGFLQGQFLATISSDRFEGPIENQLVSMNQGSITSPMTETVISWPECKRGSRSPNARVITEFFRKFKISN